MLEVQGVVYCGDEGHAMAEVCGWQEMKRECTSRYNPFVSSDQPSFGIQAQQKYVLQRVHPVRAKHALLSNYFKNTYMGSNVNMDWQCVIGQAHHEIRFFQGRLMVLSL